MFRRRADPRFFIIIFWIFAVPPDPVERIAKDPISCSRVRARYFPVDVEAVDLMSSIVFATTGVPATCVPILSAPQLQLTSDCWFPCIISWQSSLAFSLVSALFCVAIRPLMSPTNSRVSIGVTFCGFGAFFVNTIFPFQRHDIPLSLYVFVACWQSRMTFAFFFSIHSDTIVAWRVVASTVYILYFPVEIVSAYPTVVCTKRKIDTSNTCINERIFWKDIYWKLSNIWPSVSKSRIYASGITVYFLIYTHLSP